MPPDSLPTTLHWTPEARRLLETWLAPRVAAAAEEGAIPGEVADGLRAHVHEELRRRGVESVDEAVLAAVLGGIDGGAADCFRPESADRRSRAAGMPAALPSAGPTARAPGFRWPRIFLFFGVLLPALTLVAEWGLGMCANEFFDPLPTLWHVLLVACVPTALWYVHRTVQRQDAGGAGRAALCAGTALVISGFYSLAFGWMLGLAAMSTVLCLVMPWFLPLPWMTLAPLLAALASLSGLRRLLALAPCGRRWRAGLGLGLGLVIAGEAPRWCVLEAVRSAATSGDEGRRSAAVARLRWLPGASAMLHDACFGQGQNRGGAIDITSWMVRQLDSMARTRLAPDLSMEQARSLFFRVTGRAFTEVPPRSVRRTDVVNMRLGVGRAARTGWVWDGERGGATVGARLPGLSLAASRMEWHAEPQARLGYGEWTLEFSNGHANAQEARAQIQLPPGGCVSRLTLWVDGQPQEAAFAAQSAVRAAYQKVVAVEQRDPVLVAQVGPDLVMVQCFPVPAAGGRLKMRLGITAPIDAQGRLWLPQFVERNFSVPESLRHVVWVQSRAAFTAEPPGSAEVAASGAQTWQQDLPTSALGTARFTWERPASGPLWCEDPLARGADPRFVTAHWQDQAATPPAAVAVVIDGSQSLRPLRSALATALQAKTGNSVVKAWISTDSAPRPLDLSRPDAGLSDGDFAGGRDALEALRSALAWARAQPGDAVVLWWHGPQPAELGDPAALEQMLQFGLKPVPIVEAPLVPGAHRLTEKLYRYRHLRGGPRFVDAAAELPSFLADVLAGRQAPLLVASRQSDPPVAGTKASDQLARYAAYVETLAAFRARETVAPEVVDAAARHQVVTPVTGAVVLETKRQFSENGLAQVDPASVPKVPTVPEPGTAALLLASVAIALRRRR